MCTRTLSEKESRPLRVRVFVRHVVKLLGQSRGTTEELYMQRCYCLVEKDSRRTYHSHVSFRVLFCNGRENTVPVRPSKVCRRTEGCDSVLFSPDILNLG